MSKAVADLIKAFPESSFDNTGGGCMVVAVPAPSAEFPDGGVVITGVYGNSGSDNFGRGEDDSRAYNHGLTGFYVAYHAEWYSEDSRGVDPVDVYESEAYSPLLDIPWDSPEYPEDEEAYEDEKCRERAALEVGKTVEAVRAYVATLTA